MYYLYLAAIYKLEVVLIFITLLLLLSAITQLFSHLLIYYLGQCLLPAGSLPPRRCRLGGLWVVRYCLGRLLVG